MLESSDGTSTRKEPVKRLTIPETLTTAVRKKRTPARNPIKGPNATST